MSTHQTTITVPLDSEGRILGPVVFGDWTEIDDEDRQPEPIVTVNGISEPLREGVTIRDLYKTLCERRAGHVFVPKGPTQ